MFELDFPSELLPSLAASLVTDGQERLNNLAASIAAAVGRRAPHKTGALQHGFVVTQERSAYLYKIVFQIAMDYRKNNIFVKYAKAKQRYHKKTGKPLPLKEARYYYPASQEYGFRTKDGGRKPGLYFVKTTAVASEPEVVAIVADITEKVLQAGDLRRR